MNYYFSSAGCSGCLPPFFQRPLSLTLHVLQIFIEGNLKLSAILSSVFSILVHSVICSQILICNSLLTGHPQSLSFTSTIGPKCGCQINNTPATLLPHVYLLTWTTVFLFAYIKFKILILFFKAKRDLAPKHLAFVMPLSASSHWTLRSSNSSDMGQSRSFASIGSSFWNILSPSLLTISSLHLCFSQNLVLLSWPCVLGAPLSGSPYQRRFLNV